MGEMKTEVIGRLITFTGTVTRTSEVRPMLLTGVFRCIECGMYVNNVEQNFHYTTPNICPIKTCGNRNYWYLVREASTYSDWQKARVQELSNEIPTGSMPRSIDVILKADVIESVSPGDTVMFTGALIVVPNLSYVPNPLKKIKTIFQR